MYLLICRTLALAGMMVLVSAAATAQTATAGHCRQQYANDRAAQLNCARKAFAAAAPVAQGAPQTQQAQPAQQPLLVSPLANPQVMFGFFDRRFAGFNNGLEHLGVDFSAAAGTAVMSICDGTVVSNNTGHTDTISAVLMVEHECPPPLGKVYAYYGHVYSDLPPGVSVSAGSGIGNVREWPGNGHLHLGLSTRLQEESWGLGARGTTLQELEAQGWLNPLDYFAAMPTRQAAGNGVRPPAARAPMPKAGRPAAAVKAPPPKRRR
jgi:murein DD-endopeptidase MepM/ murein hydrolase activator NlpD